MGCVVGSCWFLEDEIAIVVVYTLRSSQSLRSRPEIKALYYGISAFASQSIRIGAPSFYLIIHSTVHTVTVRFFDLVIIAKGQITNNRDDHLFRFKQHLSMIAKSHNKLPAC